MDSIAILGRIPKLSLAELERVYGSASVEPFSSSAALLHDAELDVQKLGGITKAGNVTLNLSTHTWNEVSKEVIRFYSKKWQTNDGKQTLGISVYDWDVSTRDIQKVGLTIKSSLKSHGVSLRLIPNSESILNTATSHHNKLGLSPNKTELLIVKSGKKIIVAESTGAQNITALAARDQGRPKRDAFVGMLPPKLALSMVNMAVGPRVAQDITLLDPFCGTGVILQEAALLGMNVYGTDLSEKMIDYTDQNLAWLKSKYNLSFTSTLRQDDAITANWQTPIDVVASETYLGQPFSAPPAPDKLAKVRRITNEIVSKFLANLASQIPKDTPLCIAVPAWRDTSGRFTHLPLTGSVESLGYHRMTLDHVDQKDLLYFREDQVVARELLLLVKA